MKPDQQKERQMKDTYQVITAGSPEELRDKLNKSNLRSWRPILMTDSQGTYTVVLVNVYEEHSSGHSGASYGFHPFGVD